MGYELEAKKYGKKGKKLLDKKSSRIKKASAYRPYIECPPSSGDVARRSPLFFYSPVFSLLPGVAAFLHDKIPGDRMRTYSAPVSSRLTDS